MTKPSRVVRLIPYEETALEPFVKVIRPPVEPGEREFYTAWLGEPHEGSSIRLHTNKVSATELPFSVDQLERHPRTAQIFMPLDVSRYVALVAPSLDNGLPDLSFVNAMIVPGDRGVVFAENAWHAGATVLDRTGSFCVLHYRDDTPADDVFLPLAEPLDVQG